MEPQMVTLAEGETSGFSEVWTAFSTSQVGSKVLWAAAIAGVAYILFIIAALIAKGMGRPLASAEAMVSGKALILGLVAGAILASLMLTMPMLITLIQAIITFARDFIQKILGH